MHFKKCSFWVSFSFIVLLGFLFILLFNLQKQLPVIPDVNAQMSLSSNLMDYSSNAMNYSSIAMMGSYAYTNGSYNLGNVGSYASSFGFMDFQPYSASQSEFRMTTAESCGSFACVRMTAVACGQTYNYAGCGTIESRGICMGGESMFICMSGESHNICGGYTPATPARKYEKYEMPSKYEKYEMPSPGTYSTCSFICGGGSTFSTCYGFGCGVPTQGYCLDRSVKVEYEGYGFAGSAQTNGYCKHITSATACFSIPFSTSSALNFAPSFTTSSGISPGATPAY